MLCSFHFSLRFWVMNYVGLSCVYTWRNSIGLIHCFAVALSIYSAGPCSQAALPNPITTVWNSNLAKVVGFVNKLKVALEASLRHLPGHQPMRIWQSRAKLTIERENSSGIDIICCSREGGFTLKAWRQSLGKPAFSRRCFTGPLWNWMCGKDSVTSTFGLLI